MLTPPCYSAAYSPWRFPHSCSSEWHSRLFTVCVTSYLFSFLFIQKYLLSTYQMPGAEDKTKNKITKSLFSWS